MADLIKPKPGTHTKGALAEKARMKKAHEEQLQIAVEFVRSGGGGVAAAVHEVKGCSRSLADRHGSRQEQDEGPVSSAVGNYDVARE